ncbi:MAG: Gfo/Idh/MocA family oxidoreductase [Chloroflexi bacterium]|nr:Gfo/Idh/MocA family oxidoreductase [Chloroflexota bacterium]
MSDDRSALQGSDTWSALTNAPLASVPNPKSKTENLKSPVGVAAIGCGYWGPNVIRNLAELPGFRLRAICDLSRERLEAIGRRYPAAWATTRYEELLGDPEIEAVYVATPVSTHYPLVRAALRSGKHVLVEKPLATSVEQGEELCELASSAGRTLMVGHTFVYSPPVRKVKELLDTDVLGQVFYIDIARVNLGLFQKDVSVLWDLAPHDLSILLYWLGCAPLDVSARGRSFVKDGLDDVAFLTLQFPNEVLAQLHVSWLAPSKLRRTTIVGSKRMVVYDDVEAVEKVKVFDRGVDRVPESFGEFQLTYRSGDVVSPKIENTEPLYLQCSHFLECIRTGCRPLTAGPDGVEIIRILAAAQRSMNNGGAIEPVQPRRRSC